jgi:hypothetical protein
MFGSLRHIFESPNSLNVSIDILVVINGISELGNGKHIVDGYLFPFFQMTCFQFCWNLRNI